MPLVPIKKCISTYFFSCFSFWSFTLTTLQSACMNVEEDFEVTIAVSWTSADVLSLRFPVVTSSSPILASSSHKSSGRSGRFGWNWASSTRWCSTIEWYPLPATSSAPGNAPSAQFALLLGISLSGVGGSRRIFGVSPLVRFAVLDEISNNNNNHVCFYREHIRSTTNCAHDRAEPRGPWGHLVEGLPMFLHTIPIMLNVKQGSCEYQI